MSRLVISAPGSGSGKTTLTLGLLHILKDKGVGAFKVGPDFIDPLFHKEVLGISSRNLDGFFLGEDALLEYFSRHQKRYNVIEGVMGFYDGKSLNSTESSSYDVAMKLKAPVLLVVDLAGMGHSVCALIQGYVNYLSPSPIQGVVLNHCSKVLFESLKPVIEEKCGIEAIGYIPHLSGIEIQSRTLGLKAEELNSVREKIEALATVLRESIDLERLMEWMENAPVIDSPKPKPLPQSFVRIGVTRDQAFCFYYEDNLELLKSLGAELIEFSPLDDTTLPEVEALYFGGGYQVEYAQELSKNKQLHEGIRESNVPILAEGGGYFYLCQSLDDLNGNEKPMVGLLPGRVSQQERLVNFGYQTIHPNDGSYFGRGQFLGHHFQYWQSDDPGLGVTVTKGSRTWQVGYQTERIFALPQYLYLPSNIDLARQFVETARRAHETTRD